MWPPPIAAHVTATHVAAATTMSAATAVAATTAAVAPPPGRGQDAGLPAKNAEHQASLKKCRLMAHSFAFVAWVKSSAPLAILRNSTTLVATIPQ